VHRFLQLCVTAIPQKTQRKPQKTQSDTLRCTEFVAVS